MSTRPESSPAMPLVSGLSVARPASAMGGIDPGASPEPVPRSALVSAEPFANPARARRVAGAAPMDGPETDKKSETAETVPRLWVVPFDFLHSLESNIGEVANVPDWVFFAKPEWAVDVFRPDGSDTEDDDQFDPNRALTDTEEDEPPKYPMVVYSPPGEVAGDTEDDFDARGYPTENEEESNFQEEQRQIARNDQAFGAQPHPEDEVEQEELRTVFGIEGVFQAFKGRKPRPKVNWSQLRRMPQPAAAAGSRYPVRAGRGKRDHGEFRELHSDDCSDESAEEEAEEPDEMIDDNDTPEEYADFARMARKAARKAVWKAEKKAAKKAKKVAKEVIDLTGDSA